MPRMRPLHETLPERLRAAGFQTTKDCPGWREYVTPKSRLTDEMSEAMHLFVVDELGFQAVASTDFGRAGVVTTYRRGKHHSITVARRGRRVEVVHRWEQSIVDRENYRRRHKGLPATPGDPARLSGELSERRLGTAPRPTN